MKKLSSLVFMVAGLVLAVSGVSESVLAVNAHANEHAVCPANDKGSARCHAHVVVDAHGNPQTTTGPVGYGPAQFHSGYAIGTSAPAGTTIAIVDAYNDSYAKTDLDHYDTAFGLPFFPNCSSTVTTSCFKKVNQRGTTAYPSSNSGWALEISLDVQVAHAICQNCKLILVEADSSSYTNLMTAVDQAVAQGAKIVSNSYGSSEFSGETGYDSHFNHPGIVFTFSSGDSGYGAQYPAASQYVTSVGGTTLTLDTANNWVGESAWNGGGSGCSAYETKPSFQTDACANRMVADVSADADPNSGAAVYDSVRYSGHHGWFQVGGTSLAAPLVAAIYALNGGISAGVAGNSVPYSQGNSSNLHDVVTGSNGTCAVSFMCAAGLGYDGPTGLGSPLGVSAF